MSSPESTNGDLQVATVGSVPLGLEHTCCFTRELARPEGFGRASPTIVIEGVEELVEALRAA